MVYGVVKNWDSSKGFGFITTDQDDDYFFHSSNLDISLKANQIREGLKVKFDVQSDFKGERAIKVRKA